MSVQGYGRDMSCMNSLSSVRMSSGRQLVVEALVNRLSTPRGMLRKMVGTDDSAEVYGRDLVGIVGAVGVNSAVATLPGHARAEVLKDDRVATATFTGHVTEISPGKFAVHLTGNISLHDAEDSFTLTLSVDDVTLTLLGVR